MQAIGSASQPCVSAMAIGLEASSRFATEGTPTGGQSEIGEAADLDVGSPDPSRELEPLLQMSLGIVVRNDHSSIAPRFIRATALTSLPSTISSAVSAVGRLEQRLHLFDDRADNRRAAARSSSGRPRARRRSGAAVRPAPPTHVSRRGRGTSPHRPTCRRPAGRRQRPWPAPDWRRACSAGRRPGGRHRRVLTVEREAEAVLGRPVGRRAASPRRPARAGSRRSPARGPRTTRPPRGAAPATAPGVGAPQLEAKQIGEELVVAEPGPLRRRSRRRMRSPASSSSRIRSDPVVPRSRSASDPFTRSRIDVRSRSWRTGSGWRCSTSANR